jgi:CheY-like chemotaxis protein
MLRILVVEDDDEKRARIVDTLASVTGVEATGIDVAADVQGARRAIMRQSYDLLVLDIALPVGAGGEVRSEAGAELLEDMLAAPDRFRIPTHVVGITAYPDVVDRVGGRFSSRLLTLLTYEAGEVEWQSGLRARVRHILAAQRARDEVPTGVGYDLGIVCALDSPEMTSVRALDWRWRELSSPGDHTMYSEGTFESPNGIRTVVSASAARKGMVATAIVAMKLIAAFRPRVLAMTGITAGVRGRVQMGSVLAASPVWDWGSGKWNESRGGSEFAPAPYQSHLTPTVRERLVALGRDSAALAAIRDNWQASKPAEALELLIGPSLLVLQS